MITEPIQLDCWEGLSVGRRVLMGSAPADILCRVSFADILDEAEGRGYQRPLNVQHSLEFRKYVQQERAATSALTLNLRPDSAENWSLTDLGDGRVRVTIRGADLRVMAQVDGQHRLGHLGNTPVPLPFICFVGLSPREEMELFSVINGKARGLSPSLLDYHAAQLAEDLAKDRPELFIALDLNTHPDSPWRRKLRVGGQATLGLKRVASLRMAQQAVAEFLRATAITDRTDAATAAAVVRDFWNAVSDALPEAWADPRRHMLTKGVGVYALMRICADIVIEQEAASKALDRRVFAAALADFVGEIDWSTTGSLQGFGGKGGVKHAVDLLRATRARARIRIAHG
jgi:DGQHR domain-containing protein